MTDARVTHTSLPDSSADADADAIGHERDGELLLGFLLADEFAEVRGAECQLEGLVLVDAHGGDQAVGFGRGLARRMVGVGLRFCAGSFHLRRWYGEDGGKSNSVLCVMRPAV